MLFQNAVILVFKCSNWIINYYQLNINASYKIRHKRFPDSRVAFIFKYLNTHTSQYLFTFC